MSAPSRSPRRSGFMAAMLILVSSAYATDPGGGYPITPVPFTAVIVKDGFWSPRIETNRTVTIPYAFQQCVSTGRVRNFEIADSILGGLPARGKFCSRYGFDDSDIYKIIEGASYALHTADDPHLDRIVDTLITKIARAQEPDGYLYTMRTIDSAASWAKERWVNDRTKGSHELYNLGHLYEAAVAHFRATQKRTLLDIAIKSADLLVRTFGPDKMHTVPGHEVTEIGLAKLFLVTGKREYLDLAKFFIDERGHGTPAGETYNQDAVPVLDQQEAVGHAVRAGYLYAGMADVAALAGDEKYIEAIDRIWDDVVSKKLYLTGGIGSAGRIEGFGKAYELPNPSAYCETCAAIANAYWNERMFLRHGDAKYCDMVERIIYNGFLSGVSMQGDRFFYPNPLESFHGAERASWFACACCPSNIVRFVPSIPGYVYATDARSIFVNLFISGSADIPLHDDHVVIHQESRYPWEGRIVMTLQPSRTRSFVLRIRIPGWVKNTPVPSDLYRYVQGPSAKVTLLVNGSAMPLKEEKGYAVVEREWKAGDRVELTLPLELHRVIAHDSVVADRGRVAIERGPLVYCLEGVDNPDGWVKNLILPDTTRLESAFRPELLGGVEVVHGSAYALKEGENGTTRTAKSFSAIPYYAWAHRGRTQMTVWPARTASAALRLPLATIASRSSVTISAGSGKEAINDLFLPASSLDDNIPRFHWWPKKGTTEWIQLDLAGPTNVSSMGVYWFSDAGVGECRVPHTWRVEYKKGEEWVTAAESTGSDVDLDRMNVLHFTPVMTSGLRLVVSLQPGYSAGVYEVTVK